MIINLHGKLIGIYGNDPLWQAGRGPCGPLDCTMGLQIACWWGPRRPPTYATDYAGIAGYVSHAGRYSPCLQLKEFSGEFLQNIMHIFDLGLCNT